MRDQKRRCDFVSPLDSGVMETKDIMRSIEETKDLIRRVRTPGGADRYGQPIGSIIVRDAPTIRAPRKGTRRARALARDQSATERPQARQERETIAEGRVAPEADYQAVEDGQEVDYGARRMNRWWLSKDATKRQKFYKSEAPFRERVDFDFLNNGTVRQAEAIMKKYGVVYKTTPAYKKLAKEADERRVLNHKTDKFEAVGGDSYRDFMVSLAESVRLMESEFPGWSKIHGRLYTEARKSKSNWAAYNFTYRDSKSTDAPGKLSDKMRGMAHEIYLAGDQRLADKPPTTVQTATVFGPQVLTSLRDEISGTHKSNDRNAIPHNTGGDGLQFIADGADARIAQMMNTMLHEFGHATTASISGDIAPDLDDREDVNASHRRWYKEYYADALLKFYSDNGVFKLTGKKPNFEYLADYAKEQKHYVDAAERFNKDNDMEAFRRDAERGQVLLDRARKARQESAARAFTFNGRAEDFRPWVAKLVTDGIVEPMSFNKAALNEIAPSRYAATKPVEIEAESWVSYMFSKEGTKAAVEWGRTQHEMMTWYMDDMANPDFNTTDQEA